MKRGSNNYRGLNTDTGYDSIKDGYFIDSLNIRLTTDKGESQNSVSNVKGNSLYLDLLSISEISNDSNLVGIPEIIGDTSIRNRVVLFIADDSDTNGWIVSFIYENINKTITDITTHYKHPELNFSKKHPIEALGRFENNEIERIYWTDYNNYLRSLNLLEPDLINSPVENIDIFLNIKYVFPKLKNVFNSGNIKVGVWQYAYRLKTIDGKQTLISPPGDLIHVVTDTENAIQSPRYTGDPQGNIANKSHEIEIDTSNYGLFETIELIAIFKENINNTFEAFSIETQQIESTGVNIFIHSGQENSIVTLDNSEYIINQYPFKTPKTLAEKDNFLIVANVKDTEFGISELLDNNETFDSKTKRFNTAGLEDTTLNDPDPNIDALNKAFNTNYNRDAHWDVDWHTDQQYKYQSDGQTLGGEGPNISYKFHIEPAVIDGDFQPGFANLSNISLNNLNLNDGVGNYENTTFDNVASPFKSGILRGYKRGETYRFGIVFYNKKGEASFVEYIGDIKFPDLGDEDSSVNASGTNYFPIARETSRNLPSGITTTGYNLGLEITVDFNSCPSILNKLESFKIVRVKRTRRDFRRASSGIIKVASKINVGPKNGSLEFDLRGPGNSNDVLHIPPFRQVTLSNDTAPTGNYGSGVNANFGTLNYGIDLDTVDINTSYHGELMGNFVSFYSPEISYEKNEILNDLISSESCLLITGRYGQYYSNKLHAQVSSTGIATAPFDFVEHIHDDEYSADRVEFTNSTDIEGLGVLIDIRRKMRSTGQVNKIDSWQTGSADPGFYNNVSYANKERGVEYVKTLNQKKHIKFDRNDITDFTSFDGDLVEGLSILQGTKNDGTSASFYFRNFYGYTSEANLNDGYGGAGTTSIFNKGASCISGVLNKIENDLFTGNSLSKHSQVDYFAAGPLYNDPSGESLVVSKQNIAPLNRSVRDEDLLSTPLVDFLLVKNEVYGGFSQDALINNSFISASPVIPMSILSSNTHTFEVFRGDIFINMFTLQSQTACIDPRFYSFQAPIGEGGFSENHTETTVFPVESTINIDIDHGSTIKRGVKFDVPGGSSGIKETRWRQETNNHSSNYAKILNMYKGAYNFVYSAENDNLNFFIKPLNLEISAEKINDVRAFISNEKFNGELIDSFTQFQINNFYDVSDYGPINKLLNFRNEIYFFQDRAVGNYSINPRMVVAGSDGIPTELGSGEGIKDHTYISNSHGIIHQKGVIATDVNIFYWDGLHNKFFKLGQGNVPWSEVKGVHSLTASYRGNISLTKTEGGDNPILNKGVYLLYDKINNEIFINLLGFNGLDSNSETLIYDELQQEFVGKRSVKSPYSIDNSNLFLSVDPNNRNKIYQHGTGNWGEFYGNIEESYITLVLNADAPINKILRTVEFNSIVRDDSKVIDRQQTITGFKIENEYQTTGKVNFDSGRIKRKFDKWRLNIPRDQNNGNIHRLRSSHFKLTLYFDNTYNKELILNRILYYYDIQVF